ncbi:hypothetical protein MF406_08085 [Georgenia sp. TF02-10]|uniref:hypothetical protein n=1 Tax=Georgenia sp. TF02-10 TaxID=2917725 RepID=UPI001FA70FC3|nr:hypothetical protein [Georgenia sp. TF02-10]UNX56148.1 hypothetical protein MF406_08085 [Georgenia sp. TF02-10]
MTNTPNTPIIPPDESRPGHFPADTDPLLGGDDDDQPLDPDRDENQVDSADADRQAATEGTLDTDR